MDLVFNIISYDQRHYPWLRYTLTAVYSWHCLLNYIVNRSRVDILEDFPKAIYSGYCRYKLYLAVTVIWLTCWFNDTFALLYSYSHSTCKTSKWQKWRIVSRGCTRCNFLTYVLVPWPRSWRCSRAHRVPLGVCACAIGAGFGYITAFNSNTACTCTCTRTWSITSL